MKTAAITFLSLFLGLPAFGFVAMPLAYGTNDLTTRLATDLNATKQNCFYLSGKVNRMEHEMDRLETAFLALSIVIGSAGAGVCLLTARDVIRTRRLAGESRPVKPGADSATVQGRV